MTRSYLLHVLLQAALSSVLAAATLRVPADHSTIQEALDAAADGDTVLVAPGEYVITEPLTFNAVFPTKDLVLRSEAGAEETTIRMADRPVDPDDASVVVFEYGETRDSRLEGFTITGGRGRRQNGPGGGGVLCLGSAPTISACRIIGNSALSAGGWPTGKGGGIFCERSFEPYIENSLIADNAADVGGGVFCTDGSVSFDFCVISGNVAQYDRGGGLHTFRSSLMMSGCRVEGNSAREGAGISVHESSKVLIEESRISTNQAVGSGGGLYSELSAPEVRDCTFVWNSAADAGGAVWLKGFPFNEPAIFEQCTIVANRASNAGAVLADDTRVRLSSCILWDNPGGSEIPTAESIDFSCVEAESPPPGEGNINVDPLFGAWGARDVVYVDGSRAGPGSGSETEPFSDITSAFEYSLGLSPDSPCVGTGARGRDMGADHGIHVGERKTERRIQVAAGTYRIAGVSFVQDVSLEGAGAARTTLIGAVRGLRTGQTLRGVTITGATDGALVVDRMEAPRIVETVITGNSSFRRSIVQCLEGSSPTFESCRITRNDPSPAYRFVAAAVQCDSGSEPKFTGCVISENNGVGLSTSDSQVVVTDCLIDANSAGGVIINGQRPEFRGCTITRNSGAGIYVSAGLPLVDHCTVAGNIGLSTAGGLYAAGRSGLVMRSSILWGNPGGSLVLDTGFQTSVDYSCIEGDTIPAGEGNINENPLFCGWGDTSEVYVDVTGDATGDGTEENPYPEIGAALEFDLALSAGSPCLGQGADGTDMGAWGSGAGCDQDGESKRTIHLAAGTYRIDGGSFAQGVSVLGAGADLTVIEGSVNGLVSGTVLSGVTITRGRGVLVASGAAPRIENVVVEGSFDSGVTCGVNAAPTLIDCTVSDSRVHGLYLWLGSSPRLVRCTVTRSFGARGNHGRPFGGGLYCGGFTSPVLVDCVLSDNEVSGVWCSNDEVSLNRCRISGNAVDGLTASSAVLRLTNCLVAGNSRHGVNGDRSAVVMTNCTVTENLVGLDVRGGTIVRNSIVWGNAEKGIAWDNERPQVTYSLLLSEEWDDLEGNFSDDPRFEQSGEPNPGAWIMGDYHLRPDSAVIDEGTEEGAPAVDFDGVPRPCGSGVDIGAYESCDESPVAFRRGDANADGGVNTSDAVFILLYSFRGGDAPLCSDAADIDDDGAISITDPVFLLDFLFAGGSVPPAPFEECGGDVTWDDLDCGRARACE